MTDTHTEPELGTIDVVFDGPPSHESGRFVEVEDAAGRSISVGCASEGKRMTLPPGVDPDEFRSRKAVSAFPLARLGRPSVREFMARVLIRRIELGRGNDDRAV